MYVCYWTYIHYLYVYMLLYMYMLPYTCMLPYACMLRYVYMLPYACMQTVCVYATVCIYGICYHTYDVCYCRNISTYATVLISIHTKSLNSSIDKLWTHLLNIDIVMRVEMLVSTQLRW